jgi:predicted acylesterase/phospholipase RssA
MASSAAPEFYDYEDISGRKFWDGFLLSNTPLRELIEEHKAFWEYKIGSQNLLDSIWDDVDQSSLRVPDLEVYVVNVYPSKERDYPLDHDGIRDRMYDITNSDKTLYDERVATLVTDYLDIIQELINIGRKHGLQREIKNVLFNFS